MWALAMDELATLAREFGLPEQVLQVLAEKNISMQSLVKSFEDDEQFSDFVASELQRRLGTCGRRLRMALKRLGVGPRACPRCGGPGWSTWRPRSGRAVGA